MKIKNFDTFVRMIHGSVEYSIKYGTLMIRSYYTGDYVELNLDKINPEMFEILTEEEDDEDEEDW